MDETEIKESKNVEKKLEYKIKSFQNNLAMLKTKHGATGKCWELLEIDRIDLENELMSLKSRVDKLETDLQEKQVQLETYEKEKSEFFLIEPILNISRLFVNNYYRYLGPYRWESEKI